MLDVRLPRAPAAPRSFYLAMSLLMLALVTFGFSRTIGPSLLHSQRPAHDLLLLSLHGAVFYGWMLFMVVQSALVRWRNLRVHRLIGWLGAGDAVLVVGMGLWATFHNSVPLPLEMIGLLSMMSFGIFVALAILWRTRPAFHRRLLLIGTAILTNAAFARFPGTYFPGHFFYAGTDLLIITGIAHDVWKDRSVHVVYRYVVPLLFAAEAAVLISAWRYLG